MERTSKNRTSNIPNLRGSNFEHNRTSHLGPKPNFEPLEHHQKPNCSRTLLIKNGPNIFQNHQNRTSNMSEHVILAKNRTLNLSNITKIRTVREYRTVCSTSNFSTFFHCRKCLISNRVYIGTITTIALRTTKSALKAFNGIVTLAESNCCVYLG